MLIRTKSSTPFKTNGGKQKERKPSILVSLFGAICLFGGYALAGNPKYFVSVSRKSVLYIWFQVFSSFQRSLQSEHIFLFSN